MNLNKPNSETSDIKDEVKDNILLKIGEYYAFIYGILLSLPFFFTVRHFYPDYVWIPIVLQILALYFMLSSVSPTGPGCFPNVIALLVFVIMLGFLTRDYRIKVEAEIKARKMEENSSKASGNGVTPAPDQ